MIRRTGWQDRQHGVAGRTRRAREACAVRRNQGNVAVINLTKSTCRRMGASTTSTSTPSRQRSFSPMAAAYWKGKIAEDFLKTVPIGRFAQPEEIAAMVLYLASPVSDMMTGETVVIDGGFTIR